MSERMTRRAFLQRVACLPLAVAVVTLASPLLRLFKPTFRPFRLFEPSPPASGDPVAVATLSSLGPWGSALFEFIQRTQVYSRHKYQESRIPGVIVKLPDGTLSCYSRICPHLGCTFKYETDTEAVKKGYDYRPDRPVYACPCHFSVFDVQTGTPLSGPLVGTAKRPAKFLYELRGDDIVVTGLEPTT